MRDRLDQLLAEMQREISRQSSLDETRREHLRALAAQIEARLNEEGNQLVPEEPWSVQESLALFEGEFPQLANLLREIQRVLINIGI